MTDTTVKYFNNSMTGAPALSGTAGALIGVLDACLVNGFGSVTLDSLVVASNVATGTLSTGHHFAMVGNTGPVITIAGATPAGLNGEWRIASVPGASTFTFATTGISDQTATGTITAKRSPAGFSKAFSGTNKAAYRSGDIAGTQFYLRVDDSPAQYPTVILYETMSDVDTGTGVSGTLYFGKSETANATARDWRLFTDTRLFYLFSWPRAGEPAYPQLIFGDITSLQGADAYNCMIYGSTVADWYSYKFQTFAIVDGHYLARNYTQVGGYAVASRKFQCDSPWRMGTSAGSYPNPGSNDFLCSPVQIWESTHTICRGMCPGIYAPLQSYAALSDGLTIDNVTPIIRNLFVQKVGGSVNGSYGAIAFDLTGPWR